MSRYHDNSSNVKGGFFFFFCGFVLFRLLPLRRDNLEADVLLKWHILTHMFNAHTHGRSRSWTNRAIEGIKVPCCQPVSTCRFKDFLAFCRMPARTVVCLCSSVFCLHCSGPVTAVLLGFYRF